MPDRVRNGRPNNNAQRTDSSSTTRATGSTQNTSATPPATRPNAAATRNDDGYGTRTRGNVPNTPAVSTAAVSPSDALRLVKSAELELEVPLQEGHLVAGLRVKPGTK